MTIESVKLVCFSPTGTSKKIGQAIARGFNPKALDTLDITSPQKRIQPLKTWANELLIIAVPVYMGRVPALINDWLTRGEADNTPAVCAVVYGNREYENALLELNHMAREWGAVPIAAAAYIGEHSFSSPERPVANGRPIREDLNHAVLFGKRIREKLARGSSLAPLADRDIPGSLPYGGVTTLWNIDFIHVDEGCNQCSSCSQVCPAGAVDPQDAGMIDQEKCITCCACIKTCPQNARSIKPGPVKEASKRLYSLYKEPKQPEWFL